MCHFVNQRRHVFVMFLFADLLTNCESELLSLKNELFSDEALLSQIDEQLPIDDLPDLFDSSFLEQEGASNAGLYSPPQQVPNVYPQHSPLNRGVQQQVTIILFHAYPLRPAG